MGVLNALLTLPPRTFLFLLPVGYAVTVLIAVGRTGVPRFLRVCAGFSVFEVLIGGAVSLLYQKLDGAVAAQEPDAVADRPLVLTAIGVLTTFGALKLILALFGDASAPEAVSIGIVFGERTVVTDALVDSGDLAVDPMDGTPVMLVKRRVGEMLAGCPLSEIPNGEMRSRVRLIPIDRRDGRELLTALRPDRVYRIRDGKKQKQEELRLIVALDPEGGYYGEYEALVPARAISGTDK